MITISRFLYTVMGISFILMGVVIIYAIWSLVDVELLLGAFFVLIISIILLIILIIVLLLFAIGIMSLQIGLYREK